MTRKVCLRCDWNGDTTERGCPGCGERPLYLTEASLPNAGRPVGPDPSRRDHRETGAATGAPVSPSPELDPPPSQTDGQTPSRRREHAVVPLVVVALALTIAVGTWFAGRAQPPPPTASMDAVDAGYVPSAPTPALAAVPSAPSADAAPIGEPGIGRQLLTVGDVLASFRVSAPGWERFAGVSLNKSILGPQGAEAMLFWSSFPVSDRADPCANLLDPSVGPSAADLADAVATAPGTELVMTSDLTVGGRSAKFVMLTVREANGCNPGFFYTWQDLRGGALFPRTTTGDTIRVWIVDVQGTRLFFGAVTTEQADSELEREIQAIVGSIRFIEPRALEEVEIAERFMQARNEYDIQTAMSLLADSGATALLMDDNAMLREMPSVRLDPSELVLALEVERLYGVRYQSVRCRPDPVGWSRTQVTCSYHMDSKLRQIAGLPTVESSFGIGIRENRITMLSFPWLNVSYPAAIPQELAEFVAWIGAEHPAAGQVYEDGELFTTMGQELVHILTRRSVDLLATYLKEYERSMIG